MPRDPVFNLERIAYELGRVIARKSIAEDARLRVLDGLGKAAAIHDMAQRMVPSLKEEAEAVVSEIQRQLADGEVVG